MMSSLTHPRARLDLDGEATIAIAAAHYNSLALAGFRALVEHLAPQFCQVRQYDDEVWGAEVLVFVHWLHARSAVEQLRCCAPQAGVIDERDFALLMDDDLCPA